MCLTSENFNASETVGLGSWIIDSGATDHMTEDSTFFETYKPASSHKKIIVVDGNSVPIAGQGDAKFTTSPTCLNSPPILFLSTNSQKILTVVSFFSS